MLYLTLLVLGATAGLRAGVPLLALAIGAYLNWIDLSGTWAAFVGHIITVIVLLVLAVLEMVGDQRPRAGSRKAPPSLAVRSVSGMLSGLILGWPTGNWIAGIILGLIGALIGTFGGFEARRMLASAFGRDRPAALIEDLVAVVLALGAVWLA